MTKSIPNEVESFFKEVERVKQEIERYAEKILEVEKKMDKQLEKRYRIARRIKGGDIVLTLMKRRYTRRSLEMRKTYNKLVDEYNKLLELAKPFTKPLTTAEIKRLWGKKGKKLKERLRRIKKLLRELRRKTALF